MSDSAQVDEQFNRAVEIVHGLPKTGPIQTAYEDKLEMYSLFKQATVGDVKTSRPGMFDMLGRAKWDAWEKQRGLDQQQAKWLYVQTLQRVLRRYSDRTVARDLVRELDSYGTNPSDLVQSRDFSTSSRDSSSGSGSSSPRPTLPTPNLQPPPIPQVDVSQSYEDIASDRPERNDDDDEELERADDVRPIIASPTGDSAAGGRPHSALSSQMRYRTPMATVGGMSPAPMTPGLPPNLGGSQQLPRYTTPSAFAPQHPGPLPPPPPSSSSVSYPTTMSYPQPLYGRGVYLGSTGGAGSSSGQQTTPAPRTPLERAIEAMQASLAALHERIDVMEGTMLGQSQLPASSLQHRGSVTPLRASRSASPFSVPFDPTQTGAWSIVLRPLFVVFSRLRRLLHFLAFPPEPQNSTARLIVIRRLVLDASFVLFVWAVLRSAWRATGIRRKEVLRALVGVWHAVTGTQPRVLVDKAVGH